MDYLLYMVREDIKLEDINNTKKVITHNIYDALDNLKYKPMLMIYDLMYGLEVLKIIRSNPKNHHIKIIVATANENYGLLKNAFLLGADYYIHFPINYKDLRKIVEAIRIERLIFIQNFSFCFPKQKKISTQKIKEIEVKKTL